VPSIVIVIGFIGLIGIGFIGIGFIGTVQPDWGW
jgi:hypothetical protein